MKDVLQLFPKILIINASIFTPYEFYKSNIQVIPIVVAHLINPQICWRRRTNVTICLITNYLLHHARKTFIIAWRCAVNNPPNNGHRSERTTCRLYSLAGDTKYRVTTSYYHSIGTGSCWDGIALSGYLPCSGKTDY